MTTDLETRPSDPDLDDGQDGLVHTYCCKPGIGLCGTDLSNAEQVDETPAGEMECVVCETIDLEWRNTLDTHAPTCPENKR